MTKVIFFFYIVFSLCLIDSYALNNKNKTEKIFQICAKCHGKNGKNRAFGTSEIIAGEDVDDLIESIMFYKQSDFKRHSAIKVMVKYIKKLDNEDIKNLAVYISKLK